MWRFLMLVVAVCAALALLPNPAVAQKAAPRVRVTQVDNSKYPDITVYVAAQDAAGTPLTKLGQRDFTLTEDGKPVAITGFVGGGGASITTALVIDRSGSMHDEGKLEGAQTAARAFIGQMRAGDRTALFAFNSQTELLRPFTNDSAALTQAVARLRADGGTAVYDGMNAAVDRLKGVPGRRVLLLLTDGHDCRDSSMCPDSYGSRISLDEAIDSANEAGQPVYVVGLGERGADGRDGIDEGVLRRIADESGGEYFYAPRADELAALYARLAGNLHTEYALTYRSPRPFNDGTRRDIQVSVDAQTATGTYTEQHLINVRSNHLLGALLLLPLIGLLMLPSLGRRMGWKRLDGQDEPPAATPAAPPADASAQTPPAPPATAAPPAPASKLTIVPGDTPRCTVCDQPLRPGARFCSECGAQQPETPPHSRAVGAQGGYCDQCGQQLRAGARFCNHCGTAVPDALLHTSS